MNESFKDMPRYIRREIAARRMIRMKVNDFYKQYCDHLRRTIKDPFSDYDTRRSYKELCGIWHPDRVREYFDSRAYRFDCQQADIHNYDAEDWWGCYLMWMETEEVA